MWSINENVLNWIVIYCKFLYLLLLKINTNINRTLQNHPFLIRESVYSGPIMLDEVDMYIHFINLSSFPSVTKIQIYFDQPHKYITTK